MNDAPSQADLADVVGSWLRWAWLIAALAALGFVVGTLGDRASGDGVSAETTLALTESVVWPFFDSELELHAGIAGASETVERAAATLGLDPNGVDIVASSENSSSTLTITATADSPDLAATWVNGVATATLEAAQEQRQAYFDTELARLDGLIDQATAEIDAQTAIAVDVQEQLDAVEGTDQALISALRVAEQTIASELQNRTDTERRRADVERSSDPSVPAMEQTSIAIPPLLESSNTTAVLGGLIGAMTGLVIAPGLQRRFGKVRTSRHPELQRTDAMWFDLAERRASSALAPASSPIPLLAALHRRATPLSILSFHDVDLGGLQRRLDDLLVREVADAGCIGDPEATIALLRDGAVALVLGKGKVRRSFVAKALNDLAGLSVSIEAIVLIDPARAIDWPESPDSSKTPEPGDPNAADADATGPNADALDLDLERL